MKKPLVTIITVTYNIIEAGRKDYFIQCLDSVHNQTYENIEHIVIDGASDDGTLDLIKEYTDKGWIKYISESDEGIYDAMNKGMKMAKGKYIAFLNSDDYYHNKDAVKLSVKALESSSADFSYGDCILLFDDKKEIMKGDVNRFLYDMPFGHLTMFAKTEILNGESGFNAKYGIAADYDLVIRLVLKDYKSVNINMCIATFRVCGISSQVDCSDDIVGIYYNNYSVFYNFKNKQEAIDIKYKHKFTKKFIKNFKKYAKHENFENICVDRILKQLMKENKYYKMRYAKLCNIKNKIIFGITKPNKFLHKYFY